MFHAVHESAHWSSRLATAGLLLSNIKTSSIVSSYDRGGQFTSIYDGGFWLGNPIFDTDLSYVSMQPQIKMEVDIAPIFLVIQFTRQERCSAGIAKFSSFCSRGQNHPDLCSRCVKTNKINPVVLVSKVHGDSGLKTGCYIILCE